MSGGWRIERWRRLPKMPQPRAKLKRAHSCSATGTLSSQHISTQHYSSAAHRIGQERITAMGFNYGEQELRRALDLRNLQVKSKQPNPIRTDVERSGTAKT